MKLRVVGAGLGRTGTASLKLALEQLLGAPCYHMREVFAHPEHVPHWHAAVRGELRDWDAIFAGYAAAVDWPASAFWEELAAENPEALVLLSVREPEKWWESADETIFPAVRQPPPFGPEMAGWYPMIEELFRSRFTRAVDDRAASIAAFERHNQRVRESVPAARLLEWRASQGWRPICEALGLPVPAEPFPRTNTREEWRQRDAGA